MLLKKNLVISFDGLDGCGKTTQIQKLKEYLDKERITFNVVRLAESIEDNEWFLRDLNNKQDTNLETCIYFLNQLYRFSNLIQSDLAYNKEFQVYILDRWIYSTYIYHGINFKLKDLVNSVAKDILVPDIQFLINISYTTAIERLRNRGKDDLAILSTNPKLLQASANNSASTASDRFAYINSLIEINGDESEDKIHNQLIEIIKEKNNE